MIIVILMSGCIEWREGWSTVLYVSSAVFGVVGYILYCSTSCKGRLNRDSPVCQNPSCKAYGSDSTPPELYFDLKVTVADHTDGISIWLSGQPAEAFLQCSVRGTLCVM